VPGHSRGSTGSDSSASTANTHWCTRHSGSPRAARSSAAEPSHVVLATRADDHNRLLAAFRTYVQAHLTGPDPAGPVCAPPTRPED
jgi:hypothetical protein